MPIITIDKTSPATVTINWNDVRIAEINIRHYRNDVRIKEISQRIVGTSQAVIGHFEAAKTGDDFEWDTIGIATLANGMIEIEIASVQLTKVTASKDLELMSGSFSTVS